ncbi:zinc-binding dehydrogenase [Microbacterium sp. AGC85]
MFGAIVVDGRIEVVDDLEVRDPEVHEVRVQVTASGLCRSDLLHLDRPSDQPVVIGHEAAGVVREVGEKVTSVRVGDTVAVTCQVPCGRCDECARGLFTACSASFGQGLAPFTHDGRAVRSMARVSSLASEIVVDELQVHPISGVSPAAAALIGCAVSTGYGMTKNVARLARGESLMVFGVGGIGINAIQSGRLLGASRITAVDINPHKADVAAQFGASEFVQIERADTAAEIVEKLTTARIPLVDAIVDCTGQAEILTAAQELLKPGGRLGLVGIPHRTPAFPVDINQMMHRHLTITGALNGATNPYVDMQELVQFAQAGALCLEEQISHRWPLKDVAIAIEALRRGDVVRIAIDMPN